MNVKDLTVKILKTPMLEMRAMLFPNGYGLLITGGPYVCGDGENTFDVTIIKHNFKTDKDIDYYGLDFSQYTEEETNFVQDFDREPVLYASEEDIKQLAIEIKES